MNLTLHNVLIYNDFKTRASGFEPSTTEDSQAPVRACHRYIKNRPEQLDYKTAIEQDLPIGS
jgi:hypothetical protein